jgi:hypothetical protein
VVAGSKLNKVLIDGGSGLNVIFTKTLKKMKLDITHMLIKSTSPFYGIVPGNTDIPLGSVVLPVTFGETRENYRTEYIKFEVARLVVWTSLGPLPRWVLGPTTRWAPGTTRLVPHGT